MDVIGIFDEMAARIVNAIKGSINSYCDLETTDDGCFIARDGSVATVFKYNGFTSLVSKDQLQGFCSALSSRQSSNFSILGHVMQVVFLRHDDAVDELTDSFAPIKLSLERLQLDIGELVDETSKVMQRFCLSETVFIVLWTRPVLMDPVENKLHKLDLQEKRRVSKAPRARYAQNTDRAIPALIDKHKAFVSQFVNDLEELKGSITQFDLHQALSEVRRSYDKNVGGDWRPVLVGDKYRIRWKQNSKRDMSEFAHPRLDQQLFVGAAYNGSKNGRTGVTDVRAVRYGDRIFAPVLIKLLPANPVTFSQLFNSLNKVKVNTTAGEERLPYLISFRLEGDGLSFMAIKRFMSSMLNFAARDNKDMSDAFRVLEQYKRDGQAILKMQISAVTWARHDEGRALMVARSKLSRALSSWGSCLVEEETGNPASAWVRSLPLISMSSDATAFAVPMEDALSMLPLFRPASPYKRATTMLRTLDGKPLKWECFSDQQNTWLTLLFGGPGTGKSLQANRMNVDMCTMPGLMRLPYLGIVDVGVSSSGVIELIKSSLPEDQRHLCLYRRVQNTREYAVNMFDTQLFNRYPTSRERELVVKFLTVLATTPDALAQKRTNQFMTQFVGDVVTQVYEKRSDKSTRGTPREYSASINEFVRQQIALHDIPVSVDTTWWALVDEFGKRGLYHAASVAQRYAVPTLNDALSVAAELRSKYEDVRDGSMSVAEEFSVVIGSVNNDFPAFADHTHFDIADARVVSLDLQEVVQDSDSAIGRKRASLFYMMAINAFMRKINLCEEELNQVNSDFRSYHANRVRELQEDHKRLFIDEYHKTNDIDGLRESILVYGRESRKWQLEVVLASQLPQDFANLSGLATTTIILDSGNAETRRNIKEVFGLSDVESDAMNRFVNGPSSYGATMLAKVKTKTGDVSQLFTSTLGPLYLWALSTTAEDMTIRSRLYKLLPVRTVLSLLSKLFPNGSCKSYVLDLKSRLRAQDVSNEDFERSIFDKIEAEILDLHRKSLMGNGI